MRCSPIILALLLLASLVAIAPAHEPDERAVAPDAGAYRLTPAYLAGSAAERAGMDAEMAAIPGADPDAVELGHDLDGDGDADEIHIHLEVIEIQEEVYPGQYVTFWVFAPLGSPMGSPARLPSPTIRVEEGDVVYVTLHNTHYLPHTIHFHGMAQDNAMDGVPDMTQRAVAPGRQFTYRFVAKTPGTYWYHCHVQDHIHPLMGLAGMIIVEPNRPNNHFAHLIPGAGRIEPMAKATAEQVQGEYSLVYMDIDDRLNRIPAAYSDPREIERRMHRDYDSTQRKPNIFLLNGRSYPFTVRDTPILVKPDETTKLRILNVGGRTLALHTHGHHPTLTDLDGYPVPKAAQVTRDTFAVAPAQRIDLALRTGSDGVHANGPGVWLMHDHTPEAASNKGINPGGDHTMIVYEGFMGADGLPIHQAGQGAKGAHELHLDADYYAGKRPVFGTDIFHTTEQDYDKQAAPPAGGAFDYPRREARAPLLRLDLIDAERHRVVADACAGAARGFRRVEIKAGTKYARDGEVFGFEPREIHAERCEELEIVLDNSDQIRHDLMILGLNPAFALNVLGPNQASARLVVPDQDITLTFHCHVATHEKVGMAGRLVVGRGSAALAQAVPPGDAGEASFHGTGTVIAVLPRLNRLIVNHEEIKGFMPAMEMSYPVEPVRLLDGLNRGDRIEFSINGANSTITAVKVIGAGR
ncbi:MAG TPA: multicopper oxidase domain-containing protein [Xanthobacteraceae bacterium]|nr:multicopper oxidase domain-containing protein [Xanthobacteraceae bacterium]